MATEPLQFTLGELADFLDGSGTLDGIAFGELHPTEPGRYWWRKHLRAAIAAVHRATPAFPAATAAMERGHSGRGDDSGTLLSPFRPAPTSPEVDDAMVKRYLTAVHDHLGNLSPEDWEAERADKVAALRRVARIGLTAALAGLVSEALARRVLDAYHGEAYMRAREGDTFGRSEADMRVEQMMVALTATLATPEA